MAGERAFFDGFILQYADLVRSDLDLLSEAHLFSNDADINPSTELADLTESDWDGYEAQSLIGLWDEPMAGGEGRWLIASQEIEFERPDDGSYNVYGLFVTNATGLIMSRKFAESLTVESDSDRLRFRLTVVVESVAPIA